MNTIQKFVNSNKTIKREYKIAMKKRYDKNNDDFISIDEYLDNKISLGDNESKGKIYYHYQNHSNIYNYFFLIKLKEIKKYSILCFPDYIITNDKYKYRNSIYLDTNYNYYIIPDNLKKNIQNCYKNKNHILLYLSCSIKIEDFSHSNMIIINLKKNIRKI